MDTRLMSEVAKQWKKAEPLREELMIYLTQGCGLSHPEAGYYYRRLRTDGSIFREFTSTVRNGEFPPIGMLTIEGFTAKELAEKHGFNVLQAYDALLKLKENASYAESLRGETGAESADDAPDDSTEKKGLFGKLFKK